MTQVETFKRGIHSRPFSKELNAYNGVLDAEWDYGGVLTASILSRTSTLLVDPWQVKIADLSYWQGDIDFAKLATKVQVVILRGIYGNKTIDLKFDEYYTKAKDNGLEIMIYHYLKPSANWKTHAETMISLTRNYPNIGLWGDLEENGNLNKAMLESWIKKYFDAVLAVEKKTGIYSSKGFLDANLGLTNWLKWLDLWIAAWTIAPYPSMPNEWTNINNPRTWKLWQWTSKGSGFDHGVSSKYIDLNRYHGTIEEFNAEYGTDIKSLEQEIPDPPLPPTPPETEENIMNWYVKLTTTPYLNVREVPNGLDIGNLYPGNVFKIKDVVYGYSGAWAQIAEGEFIDKWVCLHNIYGRFCEPVGA